MIGLLRGGSENIQPKREDFIFADSLKLNQDTITYNIDTKMLPEPKHVKKEDYVIYMKIYLKNLTTNKDTIYFESVKTFYVTSLHPH